MNKIVILASGAELDMTMASFQDSHKLFKIFMRELGDIDIPSLAQTGGLGLKILVELVKQIASSEAIEQGLWPCMDRCTYRKAKVTKDLFEDEEIRADFLPIAKEVLMYNLSPFFKNLSSLLKIE